MKSKNLQSYWGQLKSIYKEKKRGLFHTFPLCDCSFCFDQNTVCRDFNLSQTICEEPQCNPHLKARPCQHQRESLALFLLQKCHLKAIPGKWFHIIINPSNFSIVPHSKHQHSTVLIMKSSVSVSWGLSKVLHGCVLPWYRSPSNHSPKLPLKVKNKQLWVSRHAISKEKLKK